MSVPSLFAPSQPIRPKRPHSIQPIDVSHDEDDAKESFKRIAMESAAMIERATSIRSYFDSHQVCSDVGFACVICQTLNVNCAMLTLRCGNGSHSSALCYECFVNHVTTSVQRNPEDRLAVSPTSNKPSTWMNPNKRSVEFDFTVFSCPLCRQSDCSVTPIQSQEFVWVRQLWEVARANVTSKVHVSVKPVSIPCGCSAGRHDSDQSWMACSTQSFDFLCPSDGCGAKLRLRLVHPDKRTLRQQVHDHLTADCGGTVRCSHCDDHHENQQWHRTISTPLLGQHYQLHVRLFGLWCASNSDQPDVSLTMKLEAWWATACSAFKNQKDKVLGGAPTHITTRCPLSRLINNVKVNKVWGEPWMAHFLSSVDNLAGVVDDDVLYYSVCASAFASFFDAAYQVEDYSDDQIMVA